MNYRDTFILISDDCSVRESKVPESNRKKQTIAEIEYRLISEKPHSNLVYIIYIIGSNIEKGTQYLIYKVYLRY
ncbi:DUF6157 family protein [Gracilibacillus salitolerans]|uniref:DUF6157 family protein n=1 Tax=Gracilibacillus salitolerans TaxID=2663022 RepID=UPI0038992E8D